MIAGFYANKISLRGKGEFVYKIHLEPEIGMVLCVVFFFKSEIMTQS